MINGKETIKMLKKFTYIGAYWSDDMNIDVFMRNPLECGLASNMIVFDVLIKSKLSGADTLPLDDFSFYLMDADSRLYNTQNKTHADMGVTADTVEDTSHTSTGLIISELKYDYLYQDMRLMFYNKTYNRFGIIKLEQK
jgi:hypothetical protein